MTITTEQVTHLKTVAERQLKIMPDDVWLLRIVALCDTVQDIREAVDHACTIIETGDQRLLAADGPAGNQPPDISLTEWRDLYIKLDQARK